MKKRVSIAGLVPVMAVALSLVACSHNKPSEQQQAGQAKQGQTATQSQMNQGQTAQAGQTQSQPSMLGEEHVSPGTAQIQREKKVVSTVIVKEKIPTVKEQTIRADINRMNAKQFAAIGFPTDVAQNIVQYRDRNGSFHNINDLANVDGVTQSMLDKFDGTLGVDQGQAQAGISGQSSSNQSSSGLSQDSQSGQSGGQSLNQ
jgi:competence ComEA-like helix-hairpin-helix protein